MLKSTNYNAGRDAEMLGEALYRRRTKVKGVVFYEAGILSVWNQEVRGKGIRLLLSGGVAAVFKV